MDPIIYIYLIACCAVLIIASVVSCGDCLKKSETKQTSMLPSPDNAVAVEQGTPTVVETKSVQEKRSVKETNSVPEENKSVKQPLRTSTFKTMQTFDLDGGKQIESLQNKSAVTQSMTSFRTKTAEQHTSTAPTKSQPKKVLKLFDPGMTAPIKPNT